MKKEPVMRTRICLAIATTLAACLGGYWYFSRPVQDPLRDERVVQSSPLTKQLRQNQGTTEESEPSGPIEPLIVDRGETDVPPVLFSGPLSNPKYDEGGLYTGSFGRGAWTTNTKLPPRPDATRRMPYADEEQYLDLSFDPIRWILETGFPRLKLFDDLPDDGTEESEPMDTAPPAWHPHAYPHCPYTGGCPAPYPYRMMPRD
jgi:hypothetical protein